MLDILVLKYIFDYNCLQFISVSDLLIFVFFFLGYS